MSSFKFFLDATDCQMQNSDVRRGCEYNSYGSVYSLSPVQFRSEVQKQLARGLRETSAII